MGSLFGSTLMTDRGPPLIVAPPGNGDPSLGGHYGYVDNLGFIGQRTCAQASLEECGEMFGTHGLEIHERVDAVPVQETLGSIVDGRRKCCSLTDKRYFTLRGGIDALLRRRKVSGELVRVVVGHCMPVCNTPSTLKKSKSRNFWCTYSAFRFFETNF